MLCFTFCSCHQVDVSDSMETLMQQQNNMLQQQNDFLQQQNIMMQQQNSLLQEQKSLKEQVKALQDTVQELCQRKPQAPNQKSGWLGVRCCMVIKMQPVPDQVCSVSESLVMSCTSAAIVPNCTMYHIQPVLQYQFCPLILSHAALES